MKNMIRLENEYYYIEIEPEYGIVRRITDLKAGFELIAEPRLSENFRILLPLPEYECNYIIGNEQKLTSVEKIPDSAKLVWKRPLHNSKGSFNLDVVMWIELTGQEVRFRCEVVNGTKYQIAEVWYAFVSGMDGLGNNRKQKLETELIVSTVNTTWSRRIFSDFGNTRGQTLGCLNSEHSFTYPGAMCMPWISFFNRTLNRALYFASLEETPRVKIIRFALDPGTGEGRPAGNWPRNGETSGFPAGITMNWVHVPYTKPGEFFVSSEVILQCHEGDWRESGILYRKWFDARFRPVTPGSTWIRRETATLHTMFMLPEDNINLTFKEIPKWAQTAKQHNVNHVMIAGWQIGGHDRGYPYYEPDPRLGTYEDLKNGINVCHDMGIKVSFFVNCQPVDMTTEWYKKELYKYRILDPHGEQYYIVNYWGMGTLSARTRFITATPFTEANPAHPEFRKALISYFKKLIETGADGLHIDKFFQTPMDFNPRLEQTSPDRAHHEGLLQFLEELFAECKKINPDFCISYEGGWDRFMPYSETSWWGIEPEAMRAVFYNRILTNGVEQPYDYNKVNRAVIGGCNLLIGPANYNRGMDYLPMKKLFEYIGEINRIRKELFDIVCLGEVIDYYEGLFKADKSVVNLSGEFAESKDACWSVFQDMKTGRRGIILCNLGVRNLQAEGVQFTKKQSEKYLIYRPFEKPREAKIAVNIEIPAEQVVFICAK